MKKSTRNIWKGFGSILSIMPPSKVNDHFRFVSKKSDEERLSDIWLQVGNDIKKAAGQYSSEFNTENLQP